MLGAVLSASLAAAPVHLRVEGLLEQVAVISEQLPRFSFLHGEAPPGFGITQASYRITVAGEDAPAAALPLWDSGEVESSNCSEIVYRGKALAPFTRYRWSVEWTSSTGVTSPSAAARFETGPMTPGDWRGAGWLSGSLNQFRNEFELPRTKKVAFARVYVAAAGCAHVEINGEVPKPDLRGICPWPVVSESVRYITHDVSSLVVPGRNALGLVAGNQTGRWRNPPQAIVLVAVKFVDGGTVEFPLSSSSPGWMGTKPYVTTSTAWDATIDWTKQEAGWSTPGFTPGAGWSAVTADSTARPSLAVSARALAMPLSTELGRVKPVSVRKTADGSFIYTFPKNFVGTIEFAPLPSAVAGSNLTVLLGEWLAPALPPAPPAPPKLSKQARCGLVAEGSELQLGCPAGRTIDNITFASFGTPVPTDAQSGCAMGFKVGICNKTGKIGNSANSLPVVQKFCLNKTECAVPADRQYFDVYPDGKPHDPCGMTVKALAAEIHCSGDPTGRSCSNSCYDIPFHPPSPPPGPDAPADYPKISGPVQQYENHILRAGNSEPLGTLFCWHGFQYVRVTPSGDTGFTGELDAIVAVEIHTNMTATGSLTFGGEGDPAAESAAEVLTHINQMTLQSQRTNVGAYMPTDCPTREKHGAYKNAVEVLKPYPSA